jgi:hypothetical protein
MQPEEKLTSRVYAPNPEKCCERCVFGRGVHAEFCVYRQPPVILKSYSTPGTPRGPGVWARTLNTSAVAPKKPA